MGKILSISCPEYEELDEMITKFILGYPRTVPILFVEKNTDIINNSFYGITTDWLILLATKKTDGEKQKILISKSNDNLSEDQMFFNNILYISKEHLSSHILYKDSSLKDVINGLQVNPKIEALPVLKDKDSDSFYGIYSYVDLFRDISSFLDSNDQKDDISNSEDSLEKLKLNNSYLHENIQTIASNNKNVISKKEFLTEEFDFINFEYLVVVDNFGRFLAILENDVLLKIHHNEYTKEIVLEKTIEVFLNQNFLLFEYSTLQNALMLLTKKNIKSIY